MLPLGVKEGIRFVEKGETVALFVKFGDGENVC